MEFNLLLCVCVLFSFCLIIRSSIDQSNHPSLQNSIPAFPSVSSLLSLSPTPLYHVHEMTIDDGESCGIIVSVCRPRRALAPTSIFENCGLTCQGSTIGYGIDAAAMASTLIASESSRYSVAVSLKKGNSLAANQVTAFRCAPGDNTGSITLMNSTSAV
jgi:hypothetical protein